MKWSTIAASEPVLGAVVSDSLIGPGVLLAGTIRRDGSARISGAEPLVMDGDLWLSMMRTSAKVMDLVRDPRILLHSIVTGPEPGAEVKVRGTVRAEDDREVQRRYAAAVSAQIGWRPVVGEFALFVVEVDDAAVLLGVSKGRISQLRGGPAGQSASAGRSTSAARRTGTDG